MKLGRPWLNKFARMAVSAEHRPDGVLTWSSPIRPERSLGDCYRATARLHIAAVRPLQLKISGDKSDRMLTEKRYSPYRPVDAKTTPVIQTPSLWRGQFILCFILPFESSISDGTLSRGSRLGELSI